MKKGFRFAGFTLLELIIVIIIIGILAILAFTQYGRMLERARTAEARSLLGDMRKMGAAYYMENNALTGMVLANVGVGPANNQIPSLCRTSHYFAYSFSGVATPQQITYQATRCIAGGKTPNGTAPAGTLTLQTNYDTGVDLWGGTLN